MNTCIGSAAVRSLSLSIKSVLSRRIVKSPPTYRHASYEGDGRTTISILNSDPGLGLMIDSYSQIGFRLNNGMVVIGPMAIFPRTVLSWNVGGIEAVNEASLSLFCQLEPKIDLLVFGVGDSTSDALLNKDIVDFIRKNKINVEMLPTEQACSTFNFLNAEKRYVAGAFIPPNTLRATEDDLAESKNRARKLYQTDD